MHTDPRLIEVANEFTLDELIRITDMKTEQEFCSRGGRSTMYPHFRNLSTHSGKVVEAYCIETTEGVTTKPEGESMSYDAILCDDIVKKHNLIGNRLEIKTMKALYAKSKSCEIPPPLRAMSKNNGPYLKGSFQQVKPDEADYGLFLILYSDCVDWLWVPFEELWTDLNKQHKGHKTEGQLSINLTTYNKYFLCSTEDISLNNDIYNLKLTR